MVNHFKYRFKTYIAVAHDLLMIVASYYLAAILRFDLKFQPEEIAAFYTNMPIMFIIKAMAFQVFGLYRGIWRYSSTPDLIKIFQAVTFGCTTSAIVIFMINRLEGFPRTVLMIDWFLLIMLLGGSRFSYRLWRDNKSKNQFSGEKENTLIVGAGGAGEQIVREANKNPSLRLRIVGFVDDDPLKRKRTLHGVKVLGNIDELDELISKNDVKKVFIAIPSATNEQIRRIVNKCLDSSVDFKTLPSVNSLLTENVSLSQLRDVKAEDLLGRAPVKLDLLSLGSMIKDRTVIVTGAGGSIGSELCRQIVKFNPKKLVLFEISELFLFNLENEIREVLPDINLVPIIGDIRDPKKVNAVLSLHKPELLFHAAAYKHVPMMEVNAEEAIKTNVYGTKILTEAAKDHGIQKFVMISTDKAVNPTNVMGTSKRIAEMICTETQKLTTTTQYITVRFGNVLGSNGSVIPTFKKQIKKGGPVTITHPDMTRYFMSIPEASQLVLQAASQGKGGEIFVLDMGKPVKISDLARDMITLAGLKPDVDIKLEYIGLRYGEKLYEELFSDDEKLLKTEHPKVRVAAVRNPPQNFADMIASLKTNLLSLTGEQMQQELMKIVPEYVPFQLKEKEEASLQQ